MAGPIARVLFEGQPTWVEIDGDDMIALDGPFHEARRGRRLGGAADLHFLAPIDPGRKVIGLMGNFTGTSGRKGPGTFIKPETTIIGAKDDIILPAELERVTFEAELGVVIGRTAKDVPAERALEHVFGYTVTNDVTSFAVLQEEGASALSIRFKMFDTFLPVGPWIVRDLDAGNAMLRSRLNGETKQEISLSRMDFGVAEVVAWVSRIMTLFPGDLISMGTPPGMAEMSPGDWIECEVEGIGVLRNRLVDPRSPR